MICGDRFCPDSDSDPQPLIFHACRPPKVPSPRDKINVRWGVYRLRSKAERITVIEAKDAEAAIAKVAEEFQIPEHDRFRLSARRVE